MSVPKASFPCVVLLGCDPAGKGLFERSHGKVSSHWECALKETALSLSLFCFLDTLCHTHPSRHTAKDKAVDVVSYWVQQLNNEPKWIFSLCNKILQIFATMIERQPSKPGEPWMVEYFDPRNDMQNSKNKAVHPKPIEWGVWKRGKPCFIGRKDRDFLTTDTLKIHCLALD